MSQQKRKRQGSKPDIGLDEFDKAVLNIIRSKGEDAIAKYNIQQETRLATTAVTKCIKKLIALSLIKQIKHAQSEKDHYIAVEVEASNTVTGGIWYEDGKLDTDFIDGVKDICLKIVKNLKVTTAEGVYEVFKKKKRINKDFTSEQLSAILRTLVLENLIIEVKSSGHGDYHSIPVGNVCYRCHVGNVNQGPSKGAMASIPCGVCPRIKECTPNGLISPSTCSYYTKWLDF